MTSPLDTAAALADLADRYFLAVDREAYQVVRQAVTQLRAVADQEPAGGLSHYRQLIGPASHEGLTQQVRVAVVAHVDDEARAQRIVEVYRRADEEALLILTEERPSWGAPW